MAQKEFVSRVRSKVDTETNWNKNNPVLLNGEIVSTVVEGQDTDGNDISFVAFKVGDGVSNYASLPFTSANAWDVYDWAKQATKPSYDYSEIKNTPTIPSPITIDQKYSATSKNAQSGTAVAEAIAIKVDKVDGKGLSSNDFTSTLLNKLNGIAEGANKYVHPSHTAHTVSGLYKITVDTLGHVTSATEVTSADLSKLGAVTTVDSTLSATSTNPVQNKVVTEALNNKQDIISSDSTLTVGNLISMSGVNMRSSQGEVDLYPTASNILTVENGDLEDTIVRGIATPVNDNDVANKKYVDDKTKNIIIDTALSTTSTNLVQNKAVAIALNGKANTRHTQPADTVSLSSAHEVGRVDPVFRPLVGACASNHFFGIPDAAITIEQSTDGGTTWTEQTTENKTLLFSTDKTFYIGGSSDKTKSSTNNRMRITLDASKSDGRYLSIDTIYHWMSTNGDTVYYTLEACTVGSSTFTTLVTDKQLSGWSGPNVTYLGSNYAFGINTGNVQKLRFTYKITAANTNYSPACISKIYGYGSNLWSEGNQPIVNRMLSRNSPYLVDYDNNVGAIVRFNGDNIYINDSKVATQSYVNSNKVTVDSALSDTSTNAVQNKVIKAAIDGKQDNLGFRAISSAATNFTLKPVNSSATCVGIARGDNASILGMFKDYTALTGGAVMSAGAGGTQVTLSAQNIEFRTNGEGESVGNHVPAHIIGIATPISQADTNLDIDEDIIPYQAVNKKYVDEHTYNNGNILNGSTAGSLRTAGTREENSKYTIGANAFASGLNTVAMGNNSFVNGENNIAMVKSTCALGLNNQAGFRYFAVTAMDSTNKTLTLGDVTGLTVGMSYKIIDLNSISLDKRKQRITTGTISAISDKVVTISNFPVLFYSSTSNLQYVFFTIPIDLSKVTDTNPIENMVFGNLSSEYINGTGSGLSFVTGKGNTAFGQGCIVNGISNTAYQQGSAIFGANNIGFGVQNLICGNSNKIYGANAAMFGVHNESTGNTSFVVGALNTAAGAYQMVAGIANDNKTDTLFEVGNGTYSGTTATSRSNAFEVYKDGHAEVQTQGTTNNSVVIKSTIDAKQDKFATVTTADTVQTVKIGDNLSIVTSPNFGYSQITSTKILALSGADSNSSYVSLRKTKLESSCDFDATQGYLRVRDTPLADDFAVNKKYVTTAISNKLDADTDNYNIAWDSDAAAIKITFK